jgi:hypothetical protein
MIEVTTTNTTTIYQVTVQMPPPWYQTTIIALIFPMMLIFILWFIFPRILRSLYSSKNIGRMESYQPYRKNGKKENKYKRKVPLKQKFFAWQIRNRLLERHDFEKKEDLI